MWPHDPRRKASGVWSDAWEELVQVSSPNCPVTGRSFQRAPSSEAGLVDVTFDGQESREMALLSSGASFQLIWGIEALKLALSLSDPWVVDTEADSSSGKGGRSRMH